MNEEEQSIKRVKRLECIHCDRHWRHECTGMPEHIQKCVSFEDKEDIYGKT